MKWTCILCLIMAFVLTVEPGKAEAVLKFENDIDTIDIVDLADPFEEDVVIKITNKTSAEDLKRFREYLELHGIEVKIEEAGFDENGKLEYISASMTIFKNGKPSDWTHFICQKMGYVKITLPSLDVSSCG